MGGIGAFPNFLGKHHCLPLKTNSTDRGDSCLWYASLVFPAAWLSDRQLFTSFSFQINIHICSTFNNIIVVVQENTLFWNADWTELIIVTFHQSNTLLICDLVRLLRMSCRSTAGTSVLNLQPFGAYRKVQRMALCGQ